MVPDISQVLLYNIKLKAFQWSINELSFSISRKNNDPSPIRKAFKSSIPNCKWDSYELFLLVESVKSGSCKSPMVEKDCTQLLIYPKSTAIVRYL